MITPREYGGLGLDTLNVTYAIEQIASVAPATAFVLLLHTLTANRIDKAGRSGRNANTCRESPATPSARPPGRRAASGPTRPF